MTFYDFIIQFVNDNNYVGDLAREISQDVNFPRLSTSVSEIESYFDFAEGGMEEAVHDALKEYASKLK
ncbi:MAG: YozE family protein [Vagococcus sp.]|uniref:YozE family protein n=1 Tax=Vagococcus sp. TaxID=1933889 RepID=UPI002FC7E912